MPRTTEHRVEATESLTLVGTPNGVILVATDGTHGSDGSVRVGLALAQCEGVPLDLLRIVEPLAHSDADGVALTDVDRHTTITRESRGAALLAQRDRTHPGARDCGIGDDVCEPRT